MATIFMLVFFYYNSFIFYFSACFTMSREVDDFF